MTPTQALQTTLSGLHLGMLDASIAVCVLLVTAEIPELEARVVTRIFISGLMLLAQIVLGAMAADRGQDALETMLHIGHLALGASIGGLAAYGGFRMVMGMVGGEKVKNAEVGAKKEGDGGNNAEWEKVEKEKKSS